VLPQPLWTIVGPKFKPAKSHATHALFHFIPIAIVRCTLCWLWI